MRKSSWIVMGVIVLLALFLGAVTVLGRSDPERLTQARANNIISKLQAAVEHKSVDGIMDCLDPNPSTRLANVNEDQLQVLLARAFHSTGRLHADVRNIAFQSGPGDASVRFDLSVTQDEPGMQAQDYKGELTLRLRRVPVPHLLGLYNTKEWRVVGADTSGPDPATFGDL